MLTDEFDRHRRTRGRDESRADPTVGMPNSGGDLEAGDELLPGTTTTTDMEQGLLQHSMRRFNSSVQHTVRAVHSGAWAAGDRQVPLSSTGAC
jgi:hypothetical protein